MLRGVALICLTWLVASLGAKEIDASPSLDLKFEQNSCSVLYENLKEQSAVEDPSVNCDDVGAALAGTTGNYPFWLGCLGHDEMPTAAHLARCVMLSSRVKKNAPSLAELQTCDDILGFYEENLRASDTANALPTDYDRPTCDQATEARLLWSGSRPAWVRCRGYDRANEKVHAVACLLGESRLERLDDCPKVRALYEERLIAAYGQKPEGYRPIRCGNVKEIVARASEELERLRSEQRKAQLRAAAQRVRVRRPTPQINMEQLIKGLILLRMQAEFSLPDISLPNKAELASAASGINERMQDGLTVLRERETPELSSSQQNFFRRDQRISSADVEVRLEPTHNLFIGAQE